MFNARKGLHSVLPQDSYVKYLSAVTDITKDFVKAAPVAEQEKYARFKKAGPIMSRDLERLQKALGKLEDEKEDRWEAAHNLVKAQAEAIVKGDSAMRKAGVTTSLGYNFYDLRGPAYLLYPVNTPFRNSLTRMGRVNDGVGTAANWKATKNFGTQYVGVQEGQRNAVATPDENNYVATYKEIGIERAATFTSEFASEGYTDVVADEHLRGMHELWLGEEALMLLGNSGTATGNNGFQLGTAPTPTAALATGGSFATSTNLSCRVVLLSGLANPQNTQYGYGVFPTVASGLTPSYVRTNYDGSTTTVNGGTSAISAASNVVVTTGGTLSAKFTVPTANIPNGTFAYAWYVDTTDASSPSAANAILAAITTLPTFTATAAPTGTQAGNASGLSTDHSYQVTDFDGLLTYAATQGRWVNMAGASFTSGNGQLAEIEADLEYIWQNFQAQPNAIWCSADAKLAMSSDLLANGANPNAFRFEYTRDAQNNLVGGFVIAAYNSKFSMNANGSTALPIRIHPMLPPGTIYYDVEENPYPSSRLPFVRGMLVQRDYYSIEWPLTTRQWTFGTYCHEVLAHNVPWISAVRTGIGG